jgi:hypothetical protein
MTMRNAFEAFKAGYSRAVKWVDDNPQTTMWLALAALVTMLVLK